MWYLGHGCEFEPHHGPHGLYELVELSSVSEQQMGFSYCVVQQYSTTALYLVCEVCMMP